MKNVDSILKTMDTLLKSSALTPAQNTAASAIKDSGAWSIMLKNIEQFRPAEYYKDKSLFKDFDKLGVYITNYIKRPIMNFIGAGKSFELVDEDETSIELQEQVEITEKPSEGE